MLYVACDRSELFHNTSFGEQLSLQARVSKGCTIIKPFNLSQGRKRTFDETTSTYVPLAQQVEAFHKRTPNRYHLRSKKDDRKFHTNIIAGWSLPWDSVCYANLPLVEILAFEVNHGMCLHADKCTVEHLCTPPSGYLSTYIHQPP